jgi:hypothetical protein
MEDYDKRGIEITRTSPVTGETRTRIVDISYNELWEWEKGRLIQNVAPHLSPADREYLISGCTQEDWDMMFQEMEEDDG